jgi:hypothetical protein
MPKIALGIKTNQYKNGVNSIRQGTTRWVPKKVRGSQMTLLNPKTFLRQNFPEHCILG